MPVKPDPVLDLPPNWASNGNYDVGVYSVLLPWGDPNPLAGTPWPWGGQPRLNTGGFTSFCNNGYTPQIATPASPNNEWNRRLGKWGVWAAEGSFNPDADAHIMETAANGASAAVAYQATSGFFGALLTIAPFPQGLDVTAGMAANLRGPVTVFGGAGGTLSGDPSAPLTWNGDATFNGTLRVGSVGVNHGDVFFTNDRLRWRDSSLTNLEVHKSVSGYLRGHGQDSSLAAAASITLDTSAPVAPLVAANLDVEAEIWVSRAVAGPVSITLIEVGGAGVIGTGSTVTAPLTGGGDFKIIKFSRTIAADTTPRIYRVVVDGNGQDVLGANAKIVVVVASSV